MKLRTLDLFCGGGGSSWGAKNAGAKIVCGVDAWPLAAQTFKANFSRAQAINTTLDEKSGVSILGDIGSIDLILASPECTNHTCAKGNRPRDEGSKRTARYVINFARELNPRWIVLENVVHMFQMILEIEDLFDFSRCQIGADLLVFEDQGLQIPARFPNLQGISLDHFVCLLPLDGPGCELHKHLLRKNKPLHAP